MKNKVLHFTKISWKLTAVYALIFSLVLIILSTFLLYGVKYYLHYQSIQQLKNVSDMIKSSVKGNSEQEREDPLDNDLLMRIPSNENIYIRILNEKGYVIDSSPSTFDYAIRIRGSFNKVGLVETNNRHLAYINSKIATTYHKTLYVQVVKDMGNEYRFIGILSALIAIIDLLGIVISVFAGFIISKRILKPIDSITKTAQSISIHDLNRRIEIEGPDDELTRLAKTFNEMIGRLQNSFEQQNQFVSDASHELRTPVSVIQGYINLLDRWGKEDSKILDESIKAIKDETSGMIKLIQELLFLARGESGTQRLENEKFWFNELIDEVVKESRMIAPHHNILNYRNDHVLVYGDRKMLKQMLRALIDNGIKYTQTGGKIQIDLIAFKDKAKIIIKDSGIGIPEAELNHIFDRFYRVDKTRSKEKGGSGLGLSIVKWIVDAHRGEIGVESTLGKGTKVVVLIPGFPRSHRDPETCHLDCRNFN